jgi:hypothetical protein
MRLFILSLVFLAGCATSVPQVVEIPIPDQPDLPPIPAAEMECLSDQAYQDLVTGRRLLYSYIQTLQDLLSIR